MDFLERLTNVSTGEMPSTLEAAIDALGGVASASSCAFDFTRITTEDGRTFFLMGRLPDSVVSLLSVVYEQHLCFLTCNSVAL